MVISQDSDWPEALPPESELAGAWGTGCLLTSGLARRPILTIDDVLDMVCDGRARHPHFVVNEGNMPLPATRYTSSRVVAGTQVPGYLRLDQIEAALARGASLQINAVHEYVPAVADVCRVVAERTGLEAAAVAFLSPPGRGALALHQDPVHVVALQAEGSKHWKVYEPFEGQDAAGPVRLPVGASPAIETVMTPGSVVYMPPGRPHRAACEDDWSLHVSIVLTPVTTHQVVRARLEELLGQIPEREVHRRWGPADPGTVKSAVEELAAGLSATDWQARDGGAGPTTDPRTQRESLARLLKAGS